MKRKIAESIYNQLYKHLPHIPLTICYYCGQSADTEDHVPALSHARNFGADYFRKAEIPFVLVPACRECNSLLGNRELFTLAERHFFIKEAIAKHYKEVLKTKDFTEDELDDMGEGLRSIVCASIALKKITLDPHQLLIRL